MPRPSGRFLLLAALNAALLVPGWSPGAAAAPQAEAEDVDRQQASAPVSASGGPWELVDRIRRQAAASREQASAALERDGEPNAAASLPGWKVLNGLSRHGHVAGFDPVTRQFVVLGGRDDRFWLADGWAIELDSRSEWQRVVTGIHYTNSLLAAWEPGSIVLDTHNRQLLHFGGLSQRGCHPRCYGGECSVEPSVLVLPTDGSGPPAWLGISTPAAVQRRGQAAAYDPRRERMLVFGGEGDIQSAGWFCFGTPVNDLWELTLGDSAAWRRLDHWEQIPSPRASAPAFAVVDSARDRMYLARADTLWSLDLKTRYWRYEGPAPFVKTPGCLGLDAAADELILYRAGEIWTRPVRFTASWSPIPTTPGPSSAVALAWDPLGRRFLVHGAPPVDAGEWGITYEWRRATASWHFVNTGGLPHSLYQGMVYDPVDELILSVGGLGPSTSACELYVLDPSSPARWNLAPAANAPGRRGAHSLVLDPNRHRLLLFGGSAPGENPTDTEVYELPLDPPLSWRRLEVPGLHPPATIFHAAAFDPVGNRMLVHSGVHGTDPAIPRDDVWELRLGPTPRWRRLTVTGSERPGGRALHGATFDPITREFVIAGGLAFPSGLYTTTVTDCWTLSPDSIARWTKRERLPWYVDSHAFVFPALAYDTTRERVIAFLGYPDWSYTMVGRPSSGGRWTPLDYSELDDLAPYDRVVPRAVYDSGRDQLVLSGGEGYGSFHDDTRAFTWGAPRRDVRIDVRPGEEPNLVNLASNGRLPVLIESERHFDATTVDLATLRLAGAPVRTIGQGKPSVRYEDANGDGALDLIADFVPADMTLAPNDTLVELTGKSAGNTTIRGRDRVRVLGRITGGRSAAPLAATAADVPGRVAIRAARIAPDGTGLVAELAGATRGAGTLELFDVGGRRISAAIPVTLDSAYRRFEVATRGPIGSGIYFVRLRQNGDEARARIVFLAR